MGNQIQASASANMKLKEGKISKPARFYIPQINNPQDENVDRNVVKQTKYPQDWEIQNQEISLFKVVKSTQQFQSIEQKFAIYPIKQLYRIQNKPVFKKYFQEKIDLMQKNSSQTIKELLLYHGTSTLCPDVIYLDREESFNINFTSNGNFLGKATYFAVKSSYSHGYAYKGVIKNLDKSQNQYMLLCSVIVGESQQINTIDEQSKSMRETIFKNQKKKLRYESSTTFTCGSNIYAVYKNRRAYPNYLIKY